MALAFHRPLKLTSPTTKGYDVWALHRAVLRLLGDDAKWTAFSAKTTEQKRTFGTALKRDLALAQKALTAGKTLGVLDEPTLRALEDAAAFDGVARDLWNRQPPPKPKIDLGPVLAGSKSVLEQDLTHATDGLPGYPAFDDGFNHAGKTVIAPEALTVTRIGGAMRRDGRPNGRAVYATGASGLLYWFGHVESPAPVGKKVMRGGWVGVISPNHEEPHVHVGINAQNVIGHEFLHHTDYTGGAPTVGEQLAKAGR